MYAPEVVTKAYALPFSYELIKVVVLILKVVTLRVATVAIPHALEVAQGCDLRLSRDPRSREEQYEG